MIIMEDNIMASKKKIRIGIYGLRRGRAFLNRMAKIPGVSVIAVCEKDQSAIDEAKEKGYAPYFEGVKFCDTYEELLDSGINAVILANYFTDHAKCAIMALEKKIDVLSETTAAPTLAECVQLCRAVEKSHRKYLLAANTPWMPGPAELGEIIKKGEIGDVMFGEAEYLHPWDCEVYPTGFKNHNPNAYTHWRKHLPRTYYNMHSLGVMMQMTNSVPVKVSGKAVYAPAYAEAMSAPYLGDVHSLTLTEMSNGAMFSTTGHSSLGPKGKWFRFVGTKGNAETLRFDETGVRVDYMTWAKPSEDAPNYKDGHIEYYPDNAGHLDCFTDKERKIAAESFPQPTTKSGHAGNCDFWISLYFIKYLRNEVKPFFDVYKATALSAAGILAHRSILNGGKEYEVPDFTDKRRRRKYEKDTLSPFPKEDGTWDIPCCSHPEYNLFEKYKDQIAEENKAKENK